MKTLVIKSLLVLFLISFVSGQIYTFEPAEPDYSIPNPHYEYAIVWKVWDDVSVYLYVDGSQPKPGWKYKLKGFENLDGLMKWLNSSNYYDKKQKRVRLDEESIIAIYDLTRAKKIKLQLHSEKIVEPYKVEIKERRWTNFEWKIKE